MTARRVLLALVGLGLVASVAAGIEIAHRLAPAAPGGEPQVFADERGQALWQVARDLEKSGLVRDAQALVWLARFRGVEGRIHAGEYEISPAQTPQQVLDQITSGRVRSYRVVLPEGIRASEMAARLEAAGLTDAQAFLEAAEDPALAKSLDVPADRLEGYLYPETYDLPRNLPPETLARLLVAQFDAAWQEIGPLAEGLRLSKHEIVTLASIVEKETAAPEERPLIASVFLNRLDRGMRLETDPAVIYGVEGFDGNLTRAHLRDASNPYNTYKIRGLPPGPIASPGREALHAVVRPAQSDYLYFVSRNDGTHEFSRTYAEHAKAVDFYQKNRANRNRMRRMSQRGSAS